MEYKEQKLDLYMEGGDGEQKKEGPTVPVIGADVGASTASNGDVVIGVKTKKKKKKKKPVNAVEPINDEAAKLEQQI